MALVRDLKYYVDLVKNTSMDDLYNVSLGKLAHKINKNMEGGAKKKMVRYLDSRTGGMRGGGVGDEEANIKNMMILSISTTLSDLNMYDEKMIELLLNNDAPEWSVIALLIVDGVVLINEICDTVNLGALVKNEVVNLKKMSAFTNLNKY